MPEYLAPGVYVEEVSFRTKSIEGIDTSVAGIVGPTRTGPLRGTPELLTSFADFERIYGDLNPLEYSNKTIINHTAIATKAFFDNGGKKLYVARIAADENEEDTNGSNTNAPGSTDYAGEADDINGSTGFAALENIEDIAIVMAPAAAQDASVHQAVVNEMLIHCHKMRYRIGIVDSGEGMTPSEISNFRSQFNSDRLALYYPWVQIPDPAGTRQVINVPPAGFIAGAYARTDIERGVHKAAANTPILGALRFAQDINSFEQSVLNPEHINCLRSFPGRGHLIWGSRTLSTDPQWKYVNVRRYFMYLERSIEKSTQWVVFEHNTEKLWANICATVESFLYNEWSNGRIMGATPDEAFFVRCDRSTMTQNDLDNGRLVFLIGVSPIKPAEFIVFRVSQFTSDANK